MLLQQHPFTIYRTGREAPILRYKNSIKPDWRVPKKLDDAKRFMIGRVFGRLTVEAYAEERDPRGNRLWTCRCKCGNAKKGSSVELRKGHIKSCGCLVRQPSQINNIGMMKLRITHGLSGTPEHRAWKLMQSRCKDNDPAKARNYKDRGIKVCDEWLGPEGFVRFLEHIGPRPSEAHTVDRYPDNNGNYERGNVRWASAVEQGSNRRTNVFIEHHGITYTQKQFCVTFGIKKQTLLRRMAAGMTLDEIISLPPMPHGERWKKLPTRPISK